MANQIQKFGVGPAMRSCGICPPAPPTSNWVLVDRMDSSRAFPGSTVQVRLGNVPAVDSMGRNAHIRGFMIEGFGRFTTVDDNVAITAYQLRSLYQAMYLQDVTGWNYWNAIDGRNILDDHYFRWWQNLNFPYIQFGTQGPQRPTVTADVTGTATGIPADTTPGTANYDISLYCPLSRPRGVEGSPLEGMIPLASLQRAGLDAFRFRLGTAPLGTVTGNTLVEFRQRDGTSVGLTVWADVVYLDGFVIDAPYQLDSYTLTELSGVLRNPERTTEYAWIRHYPEDAPGGTTGQGAVRDLSGISLTIGGFLQFGGFTFTDFLTRQLKEAMSVADGALSRNNAAQELPMLNSSGLALAGMLQGIRSRESAAKGPLNFTYQSRSTGAYTRYLHRTVSCHTEDRGAQLADALDCDPCAVVGTKANGSVCGEVVSEEPVIVMPKRSFSQGPQSLRR